MKPLKSPAQVSPRLLILDPFVRLHRIDENSSSEVAMILGNLRLMQRKHGTAILIVHHAKKNGGSARAGQALRGSSEFHAWGDSNLYMRKKSDRLTLSVEHRAAPSVGGIPLSLPEGENMLSLEIEEKTPETADENNCRPSTQSRIQSILANANEPLTMAALRQACGIRTKRQHLRNTSKAP